MLRVRLVAIVVVVGILAALATVVARSSTTPSRVVSPPTKPTRADVERAVAGFENAPQSRDDYSRYNATLVRAAAAAPDRVTFWRGVDNDIARGFRGASTLDALTRTARSLKGTVTDVAPAARTASAVNGRPVELVADNTPLLKVYYINGILNTHEEAFADTARLVDTLGVDVESYYNPSAIDPEQEQQQWCMDAVMSLLETQRQDVLLRALQRDASAADEIEHAAKQGTLRWLWTAMTRSVAGAIDDSSDSITTASISASEYLVAKACRTLQGIDQAFNSEKTFAKFLYNLSVNSWGVLVDRLNVAINDDSSVDTDLVDMVEQDIRAGRRVVVVAHSHGTLIARMLLNEVNDWWGGTRLPEVCPPNTVERVTPPIAALYVSPAFAATADNQQQAVMLEGDALARSHLGGSPTDTPTGTQSGLSARELHRFATYLQPNTATATRIRTEFTSLEHYVLSVPSAEQACPGVNATTAPDAPTTTTTSPEQNPNFAQVLTGRFVDDPPGARFPRHYLVNSITLAVAKDGTVTGSYNVAFTIDWRYAYEVPTKCIKTYRASGELVLDRGQSSGTIENISESLDHDGCPDFAGEWSRSRGGWTLNTLKDGYADGGIDVEAEGIGFVARQS